MGEVLKPTIPDVDSDEYWILEKASEGLDKSDHRGMWATSSILLYMK